MRLPERLTITTAAYFEQFLFKSEEKYPARSFSINTYNISRIISFMAAAPPSEQTQLESSSSGQHPSSEIMFRQNGVEVLDEFF